MGIHPLKDSHANCYTVHFRFFLQSAWFPHIQNNVKPFFFILSKYVKVVSLLKVCHCSCNIFHTLELWNLKLDPFKVSVTQPEKHRKQRSKRNQCDWLYFWCVLRIKKSNILYVSNTHTPLTMYHTVAVHSVVLVQCILPAEMYIVLKTWCK